VPVAVGPGTIAGLVDLGTSPPTDAPIPVEFAIALSVAVEQGLRTATRRIWTQIFELLRTYVLASGR
jgi:hypothetical protein